MHKVFISYHHANDQDYRNELIRMNVTHNLFIDGSVDTGDISDDLPSQTIRRIIRDEYLSDSTVTIILVGTETKGRKHVDWELKSSMIDGAVNKRSGILVIMLPSTGCNYFTAAHEGEKAKVYPDLLSWISISDRATYERRYPYLPARIIDNLLKSEAKISVVSWGRIAADPEKLRFLIEATYADRLKCEYDLSRKMRRANASAI